MAAKLVKLWEFAAKTGSLQTSMRIAMKSCISSTKAGAEQDSPDNVNKLRSAIKEVLGVDAPVA